MLLSKYLPTLSVAILYFLLGKMSFLLLSGIDIVNIGLFPSEGVALAFALYFGKKILPGIFLGQFFLAYTTDVSFISSAEIGLINTMEALIAIYLAHRLKISYKMRTFRDLLWLFFFIVFILQPFSAVLSNSILVIHHEIPQETLSLSIFSWWFGNVMGQILIAPFILLLFDRFHQLDEIEYFFYIVIFAIYLYILEMILLVQNPLLLMSLSIAIIIIVIANKGLVYGVTLSVIAAMVASFSVYMGEGAFSFSSDIDNAINYNLYVLSHIFIVWVFGILFEERKEQERILRERIAYEVHKNKEQQLFMLQQNRLAQMGELISMIAHQWRQPLNNLSLINQLLVTKYHKGKLNEETLNYFKENSKKQIELMSHTIDDFRNFFQNTNDKKQKISLNKIVKDTMHISTSIFESNNIAVECRCKEEYTIFGYANSFSQVILNIFNNAKDILIENHIQNKKISIELYNEGDSVMLSIEDNAGGIKPDIINKIFDPYFSTKKSKNGTGLGLYMSKMIVEEQMQGRLEVTNSKDGAKFIITMQGGVL
jgi:signal transduction histidine kinase